MPCKTLPGKQFFRSSLLPVDSILLISCSQTVVLWLQQPSSDILSGISTADSSCALFDFYTTSARRGAGIAQVGCHGCGTNLHSIFFLNLPWSPAQQAAYLCVVWTKFRNLTDAKWKHAVLRGLLTPGPAGKKVMFWRAQRPSADDERSSSSLFFLFFPFQLLCYLLAVKWPKRRQSGSFKDELLMLYISLKEREKWN